MFQFLLLLRWPSGKSLTFGAVDSGSVPSWLKPTTLRLVFTVSLLDAQH